MVLTDIFKKSLKFPFENHSVWIMAAVIALVSSISSLISLKFDNGIVVIVFSLLMMLASIISSGYYLKVIKNQIDGSEITIDLENKNSNPMTGSKADQLIGNIKDDLISGIKYLVLDVVYMFIAFIIFAIVAFITGAFDAFAKIIPYMENVAAFADSTAFINSIPEDILMNFAGSFMILFIVGIILLILYSLLLYIATAKLADTGSLGDALNIVDVCRTIKEIEIFRYLGFYVLLTLITVIITFISGFIGELIPVVGTIISVVIIDTFSSIFIYTAIGTLYAEYRNKQQPQSQQPQQPQQVQQAQYDNDIIQQDDDTVYFNNQY